MIRNDIDYQILNEHMECDLSSIWLKISRKGRKKLVIGGIYREFKYIGQEDGYSQEDIANQENRWRRIISQWEAATDRAEGIIIGDLNLDFLKWDCQGVRNYNMIEHMKSTIGSNGFYQVIEGVTHTWPGASDSLIDHSWVNHPEKVLSKKNIINTASDHNIIGIVYRLSGVVYNSQEFQKRKWTNFDQVRFNNKICNVEWDQLYQMSDVNLACDFLESNLLEIIESEAPVIKIQPKTNYKVWISKTTKESMIARDNAKKKAAITNNDDDKKLYKTLRNRVTNEVKNDRKKLFKKQYEECEVKNDISRLYKVAKTQAGWTNKGPPASLVINGKHITSPSELAQQQMELYYNKNQQLLQRVQADAEIDPLENLKSALDNWKSKGNSLPKLSFKEVSPTTVAKYIGKLKDSNSWGLDKIECKVIKLAATNLLYPITHLVNLSISTSTFPTKWKLGRVLPLYKGKNLSRTSPASYRPITMLPTISKILERITQEQLVKHMEENKLYHPNQQAYRRGHSTTSALLELSDLLYQAAEDKKIAVSLSVDQSSAFDCICHTILDEKLEAYGLDNMSRKWISSYLSFRSQFVEIGTKTSLFKPMTRGVPQGSVLGPTLFLVYINEFSETVRKNSCQDRDHNNLKSVYISVPDATNTTNVSQDNTPRTPDNLFGRNCSKCGAVICYADDATFTTSSNNKVENQVKINENLENMKLYLYANKLCVNEDKTSMLESMNKQRRCKVKGPPPSLQVLNNKQEQVTLTAVNNCRLLGVNMGNDLSWRYHLISGDKALIPALRKQLGMLKHLSSNMSTSSRKTLAEGLVISRIQYLLPLWGGTTRNYIQKIQVILNKAARTITGMNKRTSTLTLMSSCNWLTAEELIKSLRHGD